MAADGNAADKLRGYLRELKPEARALLIAQLERKLARGEKVPGADIILEELGGASRAETSPEPTSPEPGVSEAAKSPMQTADPATLFFAFFEAFIVDDVAEYEHPGRIARACVMPIWEWICRDVLPDEAKTFADEAMGAAMAGEHAAVDQTTRAFQDRVAKGIEQALTEVRSDDKARRRLAAQIGTPQALEDAHVVASLLKSRDLLNGVVTRLPPTIRNLADDQLDAVKGLLDTVNGRRRELFPFSLVLVMSRLTVPWQLIRLATKAADSDVATKISETPYAAAVNIVLAEVERLVRQLTSDLKRGQAAQVTALLKDIHDIARGLRTEMDLVADSPWARRLSAVRAEIAALLKIHVESMPGRVRRLLRPRPAKEIVPGSKLDETDVEETEALISFVGACRTYAGELAINEMTMRAYSELQHYLETSTQTLIDGLRTATSAERSFRQSQVEAAVRFCAKVFGQEYAALLTKAADVAANSERKAAAAKA
jgi:hypothetical protein